MKNLNLILFVFLTLIFNLSYSQERREEGNLILEDIPEVPEAIKERIQQYQNTRSATLVDWLPNDEGLNDLNSFWKYQPTAYG
jgi:VanZ family protein